MTSNDPKARFAVSDLISRLDEAWSVVAPDLPASEEGRIVSTKAAAIQWALDAATQVRLGQEAVVAVLVDAPDTLNGVSYQP